MRITAVATILTISLLAACGSAQGPRPTRERILAVTDQGVIRAYDEPNEQPRPCCAGGDPSNESTGHF